jgi:(R)-2-hydroxyacyl-CoA dehydratese activating ATPase
MSYFLGIDIGSRTSKGILVDENGEIAKDLLPSGIDYRKTAEQLRANLLQKANLAAEQIRYTVSTGNTTEITFSDEYVTDIKCTARGMHLLFPLARTIIDIQNQSSQVILVNPQGQVKNFVISEKCAGGSGRFLEVVANVLRIKVEDIGPLSMRATKPAVFTTSCAVFGESEAISRVAEGETKEDILAGVNSALAEKIGALVGRVGLEEPCAAAGGGALNSGLIRSLEDKLKVKLLVPAEPQMVAGRGAAIISREKAGK